MHNTTRAAHTLSQVLTRHHLLPDNGEWQNPIHVTHKQVTRQYTLGRNTVTNTRLARRGQSGSAIKMTALLHYNGLQRLGIDDQQKINTSRSEKTFLQSIQASWIEFSNYAKVKKASKLLEFRKAPLCHPNFPTKLMPSRPSAANKPQMVDVQ